MAFNFKNMKILVVDDDASMREITGAILEKLEFKSVDTASNGDDAFDLFKKNNHNVILTDWQMEPVSGLELIKKVRAKNTDSPNRYVPVILVTAYTEMKMIEAARSVGTTELLIKPFSTDDLAKRIAYVINKPREFIDREEYTGPDRRRIKKKNFSGPYQRREDSSNG